MPPRAARKASTNILQLRASAVERALALEPDLPDALFPEAMIETNFDYNWKGAAETLRKALALAPQDPALLMWAGNLAVLAAKPRRLSIFSAGRSRWTR